MKFLSFLPKQNGNEKKRVGANYIVTIGGGTGTFTVLSGLKHLPEHMAQTTAIVSVSDSGGSTGKLRDEFGSLPVGDFRMALVGLAEDGANSVLRELLMYRFHKGEGLSGHNFGNLLLVALTEILGSGERAIEAAGKMLKIKGSVVPISSVPTTLCAAYTDGTEMRGEAHIDDSPNASSGRITRLWVEPKEAIISPSAARAISRADIIVLGPGDLYTSTLANIVVPGVADVVREAKARIITVVNLMTREGQTSGFSASTHVEEVEQYVGRSVDVIIINDTPLPADVLMTYEKEREFPVSDDMGDDPRVVRADILATGSIERAKGDTLKRSLLRHDGEKLARIITRYLS